MRRACGPVHRATLPSGRPVWVVTRYDDVRAALTDERLTDLPTAVVGARMLMSDPPDHTRPPSLLARDFTSRRIERLEPAIQATTDDLLDALSDRPAGPVDLITGFAQPLPSIVISELLGVPAGDRELFQDLSSTILEGRPETAVPASDALDACFTDLIRAKAERPGDDLLSALTKASADGDRLSEDELLATAVLLVIAGHETTGNLIGNALRRLLTDRELADRLRADPGGIPPVIEELLRIDSPVMLAARRLTTAPVRIGEVTIPEGETVLLAVGAANRDGQCSTGRTTWTPGLRARPDYCLGAPLARLEGRIALGSFLRRFPDATLAVPGEELRHRQAPS